MELLEIYYKSSEVKKTEETTAGVALKGTTAGTAENRNNSNGRKKQRK